MLSKEICEEIWHCHREIEAAENLLSEVEDIIKNNNDRIFTRRHEEKLKDVYGCERNLELGVPSGENSMRLFRVSYDLAVPVIKAHLANKKARLVELNEMAGIELQNPIIEVIE